MCGIVGFIGRVDAPDLLVKCLKRLEYRGYDSCGVAVKSGSSISVVKRVGGVSGLSVSGLKGCVGVGHTRWATHGGVSEVNAHPHSSCDGKLVVVHNGIITNFSELREELVGEGHVFVSETDTEVVVHLVEEELKRFDWVSSVRRAVKRLKGSYALLFLHADFDELVGARSGSPLCLGVGDNGFFVASDYLAFLDYTNKVVHLDDGELVVVGDDCFRVEGLSGGSVVKSVELIDWSVEQSSKNGEEHYLIKEILEQPVTSKSVLSIGDDVFFHAARLINRARNVVIVGCGSSRYAGLIGRYAIARLSGRYCEVYMGSEFQYFVNKLGPDSVVIAISQSGETADVLGPVKKAKVNGCKVISVVNVKGSTLDRLSDCSIHIDCGPEISVASTKAFTNQVLALYLLGYTLAYKLGEGRSDLRTVPLLIEEVISKNLSVVKGLAKKLSGVSDVYYIARGINFAVASEGSLKMKEVSYIHAEGMPAGELKHGTLALISSGVPVVCLTPRDYTFDEMVGNVHEAKARGAFTIGVTNVDVSGLFDVVLRVPTNNELLFPVVANVLLQLLAYYTAREKGCEIDKPRNLAKSVTVK